MIHVTVVATALVRPMDPSVDGWPRVVRLNRYCGDMFTTEPPADHPVWKKSGEVMQKIEDAMRERGLSIRPGIIEIPNQQGSQSQ